MRVWVTTRYVCEQNLGVYVLRVCSVYVCVRVCGSVHACRSTQTIFLSYGYLPFVRVLCVRMDKQLFIYMHQMYFFCTSATFSVPAAGLSSRFQLRGKGPACTLGATAPPGFRGACSGCSLKVARSGK